MRILLDVMTTDPKRQDSTVWRNFQVLFLVYVLFAKTHADVLDAMSRQFFGLQTDDQQREPHYQKGDDFSQMFGGNQENRTPHRSGRPHQHERNRPPHHSKSNHHRQGYYPPPNTYYSHHPNLQPQHYPLQPIYIHPHGHPQAHPQVHLQTHPQMMQKTNESSNGTQSTDVRHPHHYGVHFAPAAHPHAYPPPTSVEYHTPPETIVEYHHPPHHHHPPIEEHHYPEVHEYHHPPPHKPKSFHISFKQPSPDLKIIDQHVKLPPVKLRLHINPKILITTNTKDPLEKDKHHDHHDIEPYPPPDAFSDHNAPPSYNKHEVRHYPIEHHYTAVEEHHYPPPLALHDPHLPYHHAHLPQHHAHLPPVVHDYGTATYDLSHHHGYINPHRSSGHYEPSFKIKMNPIIFTEPPPTRGTTTTTTRRPTTTTTTTTTSTTTRRPRSRSRARQNARNPGFSLAFTEGSTAASNVNSVTTSLSSTETSITRRSVFGSSGREREQNNATIETRKDTEVTEESTAKPTSTSKATSTTQITTTSTTATPRTTLTSSTVQLLTTIPTTTAKISMPTKPTTISTTPKPTTTTATTSKPSSTTTAATTLTVKSTTEKTTTTKRVTSTTTKQPTTRRIPAEATTQRRRVFNDGANEIDMTKPTEASRNLEPLLEEAETTLQNSENVKIIETTMMIDGKNQTVRFYYIMQPVKLPPEIFHQMIGQKGKSGLKMLKISD